MLLYLYLYSVFKYFKVEDKVFTFDEDMLWEYTGVDTDRLFTPEGLKQYAKLLEENAYRDEVERVKEYAESLPGEES